MVSTSCETSTTGRVDNDEPSSSMLVSDEDEFKIKKYDPKDKLFVCYSIYAKLLRVKEMELFQTVRSRRELGAYFEGDKMFGRRGNVDGFCFVFAHAQSTLNAEFLMDIGFLMLCNIN
jgi:hypothetical protein